MCFGCSSGCGQCTGSIVYIMEKLASVFALTAVVTCIMATIAISIGLGIGLGYNYCYVDLKVMKEESKTNPSALRAREIGKDEALDYTEAPSYRRTLATTVASLRRTSTFPAIKHTMVLPLHGDLDFPILLSKLRGRNRNVTLELIT